VKGKRGGGGGEGKLRPSPAFYVAFSKMAVRKRGKKDQSKTHLLP